MTYDPNDPRLTAFALGELDPAEVPAIEAQLAACEESRRAVAEVRDLARLLTDRLKQEPAPALSIEQKLAIEEKMEAPRPRKRRYFRWAAVGVAASLLGVLLLLPAVQSARESARMAAASRTARERQLALGDGGGEFRDGSVTFQNKAYLKARVPGPAPALRAKLPPMASKALAPPPARPAPMTQRMAGMGGSGAMMGGSGGRMMGGYGGMMGGGASSSVPATRARALVQGGESLARGNQYYVTPPPQPGQAAAAQAGEGQVLREDLSLGRPAQAPQASAAEPAETKLQLAGRVNAQPPLPVSSEPQAAPAPAATPPAEAGADAAQRQQAGLAADEDAMVEAGGQFHPVVDNPFLPAAQEPLSTFSIDVDTASYALVRRFLMHGQRPPRDAVRIEELVNYFPYDDPPPSGDEPFSVTCEVASCPWTPSHRLVRIGLKGREIDQEHRPPSNLVFLLDVSGSMQPYNRLPLIKEAMKMLVQELGENDRVAIVVYAGASGLALPSTTCDRKAEILAKIDELAAQGSTNGAEGLRLAYQVATENFLKGGTNRVILATDGDFNVGVTSEAELIRLIQQEAKTGVFLSVLGVGEGNLKDGQMEQLADKGNGNYAYIDTLNEAHKVLVRQMGATLDAIAKDVKIQVEFNPAVVASYRLIGYENRMLAAQDFADDTKDAGEIGAGHSVTALYELIPAGQEPRLPEGVGPLRYARKPAAEPAPAEAKSRETLTVKLRYKKPDGDTSRLIERPVTDDGRSFDKASTEFRFAAAVASFAMLLRDAPDKGRLTYAGILEVARAALGPDRGGYRREFLELVRRAEAQMQ